MNTRDSGVQVSLGRINVLPRALYHGLLRVQLLLGTHFVLVGFNPGLGQFDHALRIALNASQVSLSLHQRRFG